MILVTVGTHTAPFDRLLRAVAQVHRDGAFGTDEDVVIQAGTSTYQCPNTRQFAYCPSPELDILMDQARLLITHGGIGTVLPAVRRGKHVIAIPRLRRFGEHHNDHQLDVCNELARQHALFTSPHAETLGELLRRDPASLQPFTVNCAIPERVRDDLLAFQTRLQRRQRHGPA